MLVCFDMPKNINLRYLVNAIVNFYTQVPGKVASAMQVNIHSKPMTLSKVVMLGKREITMRFYPVGDRQLKNQ